jgi:hypothetical protein
MKTAMQLMLEDLELRYKVLSDAQMIQACAAIEGTIEYAKSLIIKEKEQIVNFCWECLRGDNIHTITSNKELIEYINDKYNQTYNN